MCGIGAPASSVLIQNCDVHKDKIFKVASAHGDNAVILFKSSFDGKKFVVETDSPVLQRLSENDNINVSYEASRLVVKLPKSISLEHVNNKPDLIDFDAGTSIDFESDDDYDELYYASTNNHPQKCRTSGCKRLMSDSIREGLCNSCAKIWFKKGLLPFK